MCFRKKAILMIHGFVGGCYDFNNLQNELQIYKKFDVYTYTLPAHDKLIVNNVKYKEWIAFDVLPFVHPIGGYGAVFCFDGNKRAYHGAFDLLAVGVGDR